MGPAVGAEEGWPFSDLAGAVDPEVEVDPALLDRLAPDDEPDDLYPVPPRFAAAVVRWAALGDLPRQRFPQLGDPYEPLLVMFARGGGYSWRRVPRAGLRLDPDRIAGRAGRAGAEADRPGVAGRAGPEG